MVKLAYTLTFAISNKGKSGKAMLVCRHAISIGRKANKQALSLSILGFEVAHHYYFFNFAFDFSSTRPQNLGTANGATEIGMGYRKHIRKKLPKN